MTNPRKCPRCDVELPDDAPEGLCPACLLENGFASEPAAAPDSETMAKGSNPDAGPAAITSGIKRMFPNLEILECLGQGGMGVVYKARQRQLDRLVALKVMKPGAAKDPAFAERFTREARALAKLNHPNIVSVYDFGRTGGRRGDEADEARPGENPPLTGGDGGEVFYLLMEYMDGANLRQVIRAKTLTPGEALKIVPKICEALQFAHDQGIVHRDIKPENILLDKQGRVKIADFGLAKLVKPGAEDYTLTQAGMSMGTPRYMAPEQLDKPEEVDHRADIYSLGVVFYEMLTGEVPMGRFAPPSQKVQVDVRLDEVVLRSLEREPELRYQQASEVKTQVENISGLLEALPAPLRDAIGWEYKSKATLFGWPWLHVAVGADPKTGQKRHARGVVAVGERATGVIAFGTIARGFIACGALAFGVFSDAALAIGVLSLGGCALGLGAAWGGLAAAPISLGGVSIGWLAGGGYVFGTHAYGGTARDPIALEFFRPVFENFGAMNILMLLLIAIAIVTPFPLQAWARRQVTGGAGRGRGDPGGGVEAAPSSTSPAAADSDLPRRLGSISLALAIAGIAVTLLFVLLGQLFAPEHRLAGLLVLCAVIATLLELAALGCGYVARRSVSGRAGLIISGVGCVLGLVLILIAPSHRSGRSGSGDTPITATAGTPATPLNAGTSAPLFYTFAGASPFLVKTPLGPQMNADGAGKHGLNDRQLEALNKLLPRYYDEFVSLERQHTAFKADERGRIVVTIQPFFEQTVALAERMNAEARGIIGKDILQPRLPGNLVGFGLFRHAGTTTVTAELWKDGDTCYFKEDHAAYERPNEKVGARGRGNQGTSWQQAFPEEYWLYWKE